MWNRLRISKTVSFETYGLTFQAHIKMNLIGTGETGYVVCSNELENPEKLELVLSQHMFDPTDQKSFRFALAWLIAHWWEHKLRICPCLPQDDKELSHFRDAFVESLLVYWECKGVMLKGNEKYHLTQAPTCAIFPSTMRQR